MNTRIIVSAIIEKDGKYLFGRKPKDVGPYPNTWHILGGGVDVEKETLEAAIQREIREEAGIEVFDMQPITFAEADGFNKKNEPVHYVFHYYLVKYKNGDPVPADDIEEIRWFSKEQIASLSLPHPSVLLFKKIGLLKP